MQERDARHVPGSMLFFSWTVGLRSESPSFIVALSVPIVGVVVVAIL